MLVLGVESSCDDCSAAVVEETASGPILKSLVRRSQDALHGPFGGVVPELAAREHLLQVRGTIQEALDKAGLRPADLDRVAVTRGPGLVGSLLCGFSAGKALAWREGKPWVGVHHLLGHLNAARFKNPDLPFPALALLVSGGHTHLYLAKNWTSLDLLRKTRDDAAGEAYDKAARVLGLGYPGGPPVDDCARRAVKAAEPFTPPRFRDGRPAWSFSGIKTALKLRVERDPRLATAGADDAEVQSLCRSLQEAIAGWLLKPIPDIAREQGVKSLILSGGVACNSELRARAALLAEAEGLALAIPEPRFCTDNGAMIAAAGALLAVERDFAINADSDLRLGA